MATGVTFTPQDDNPSINYGSTVPKSGSGSKGPIEFMGDDPTTYVGNSDTSQNQSQNGTPTDYKGGNDILFVAE